MTQTADIPAPPPTWRPAAHRPITLAIFALVIAAGVLLVLSAWKLWPFDGGNEGTEDANVEGQTTVIAPQVSGYVASVPVEDFAHVQAGTVLATIDPRTYQQKLEEAKADLDAKRANLANNTQARAQTRAGIDVQSAAELSAQAALARAEADLKRSTDLVRDGSLSQREQDQNIAAMRAAQASLAQARAAHEAATQQFRAAAVNEGALKAAVEAAQAQVHAAEIDLEHTVIHAPQAGQLSGVSVRLGQFVTNGSALLYLVPAQRWVIANFKEAQTSRMAPGQPAWFAVDALGGARIRGHVERISPATGAQFAVLKPDNATGNYTKVPQRIPVRILIDPDQPAAARLRPGMSVEAHVDTAGGSR